MEYIKINSNKKYNRKEVDSEVTYALNRTKQRYEEYLKTLLPTLTKIKKVKREVKLNSIKNKKAILNDINIIEEDIIYILKKFRIKK
ncbi:MAG: hypothetical protein U9Q27_00160 [Patescibacteria group bacterium]|nr:hypothetical protein [Patescibacteria group bacterium]